MSSLTSALGTLVFAVIGVVLALTVLAAPASAAADPGGEAPQRRQQATTTATGREDTLGLVAAGATLVIVGGLAGGAWRRHRDPRAAALGH